MHKLFHPLYGYPLAGKELLKATAECVGLLEQNHQPHREFTVADDFFGVNVAPGEESASDDYILQQLQILGISQVRMDYSYNSSGGPAQRLLERLLDAQHRVMLDLLPPLAEAEDICDDPEAQQRWRQFTNEVFDQYGGRVEFFEIGNTPNRGRWSGFSARGFLLANTIAAQQAQGRALTLAGPNVSDFEPLYNATFLALLGQLDAGPQVHTTNLFVERVVEPEAYDHRVLGRLAKEPLKLNLIKKARMLQVMGRHRGCQDLICTYTCWTNKRLKRRSAWPEQKRVDYLIRYLVLAASSGALKRVYWGPLICSRDGLIDDGAGDYPAIDQVSFYERIRGDAESFCPTPAFSALAHTVQRLRGARCLEAEHRANGLSLFHFQSPENNHFLLGWCRDGDIYSLDQILTAELRANSEYFDGSGGAMPVPLVLNEHPIYIELDQPPTRSLCSNLPPNKTEGITHLSTTTWQSIDYHDGHWIGAQLLRATHQTADLQLAQRLTPEKIPALEETRVLRDTRNRLWNVADPRGLCDQVTVKLNRVTGIKRFTYRFRPSKGRRHWNNACNMLRVGIATPLPLAFYEQPILPGIKDSWYLCQFIPNALSVRDVYAAFRDGATEFRGRDKTQWFDLLAGFVCNMHNKQIIHRDLSAGNLLLAPGEDGEIIPHAIDIGRARIWTGPGSRVKERHRMLDLIRIAYKLDWADRKAFIEAYESHLGKSLSPLWKIPFHYYDNKQALKKTIKGKKKKKR